MARRSALLTTLFEDTVVVTSAEILALFSTPIELIAAPGANKYLILEFIEAFNDHGGTDYANVDGTGVDVLYNGGVTAGNLTQGWAQASADQLATPLAHAAQESIPVNTAIDIQALVANPTLGDGDWRIHLTWRVVDFA